MRANNISSQRYRKMSTGFMATGIVIIFVGLLIILITVSADILEAPEIVAVTSCFTAIGIVSLILGVCFNKKSKTAPSEKELSKRRKAEGDPKVL